MTQEQPSDPAGRSDIERIPTGVQGLDILCGGAGLVRGAIYIVMGRPGTGKTTLANQLAFTHVKRGGKAAYVTLLAESHATMLANLRTMRFFEEEAVNRDIIYVGAYKALRDDGLKGLLQLLRRIMRDQQASMLFLDGISPARAFAASEVALKEFIVELQLLSAMTRCTTVMLANMTAEDTNGPEHTMVDGLIELARGRSGCALGPTCAGATELALIAAPISSAERSEITMRSVVFAVIRPMRGGY